jgi:hypothetical protein
VFSLEGLHDRRNGIGYLGLGQRPESDPRNQFQLGPVAALYRERRERLIAGFGVRPFADLEILISSSLTQRYTDDPEDTDLRPTLSQTFAPAAIPGAYHATKVVYSELALRYDSRTTRSGVDTGVSLQTYAGLAEQLEDTNRFKRAGVEAAAYLPFVRQTTIISPKITIDGLLPDENDVIPFTEMTGQPTFRGFPNRRDYVSAVGSLDYRWYVSRFVSARVFVDVARVAPSLRELTLDQLRWATGFGFDLHTSTSELGRVAVAGSDEGFHFLFTLGVPSRFGDRQHRD